MDNNKITCSCNQKFIEDDFKRHFKKCDSFRNYFSEFDKSFGELLKTYSKQSENMLIIRVLLIEYTLVIEKKIKSIFGIDYSMNNSNFNKEADVGKSISNVNSSKYYNDDRINQMNGFNAQQEYKSNVYNNISNVNKQDEVNPFNSKFNNNSNSNNNNNNQFDYNHNEHNQIDIEQNIDICEICGDIDILYLDCFHKICQNCINNLIIKDLFNVKCPTCSVPVEDYFLKQLIGEEKYKDLEMSQLKKIHMENSIICANGSCKQPIQFEKGNVNYNQQDEKGGKLSKKACEDYANQRCRCPSCKTEFCVDCLSTPYHIDKTCVEHKLFQQSKKCKYCGEVVNSSNKGPSDDCCKQEECSTRYKKSCKKKLKCGHDCLGHINEGNCLRCLDEECKSFVNKFNITKDEYCGICYTEGLESAPCVELDCGHIIHHHCIVSQIEKKWIGPEINLKFIHCSFCNQELSTSNNKDIESILKPYKDLRDKMILMTKERVKFEGLDKDKRVLDPNDKYYNKPLEYGIDKILYYLCYKCKKPYFAGLKECGAQNDREHDPKDLICGSCGALDGVAGVSDCSKHGKEYIEYKCKFCCEISSWFCWGTTHFCESCHVRQCKHDYVTKIPKDKLPKCNGESQCKLKIKHPPNGEEFALGCSICRNDAANRKDF